MNVPLPSAQRCGKSVTRLWLRIAALHSRVIIMLLETKNIADICGLIIDEIKKLCGRAGDFATAC
jgi:hypothetical protein